MFWHIIDPGRHPEMLSKKCIYGNFRERRVLGNQLRPGENVSNLSKNIRPKTKRHPALMNEVKKRSGKARTGGVAEKRACSHRRQACSRGLGFPCLCVLPSVAAKLFAECIEFFIRDAAFLNLLPKRSKKFINRRRGQSIL